MSSGAKQLTRIGFEASPGVIATTWNTFAFTTNGLDASAQTTESQTIKDSRIAAGTLVTGVEVQGDIESEWAYGIQDGVLELIAFNAWNSNVLTFGGTTRKTLSIIRGFSDIDNFQVFTGCHINQWTLSIPDSGIVTSKFAIMGMKRTAYEVAPTGTVTPAVDAVPLTSLSTG